MKIRGFFLNCHIGELQQVLGVGGLPVFLDLAGELNVCFNVHELQLVFALLGACFSLLDLHHLALDLLLVEFYAVVVIF